MSHLKKSPVALTVLNAVAAAAADITLSGGKLTVTDLGRDVKLSDASSSEFFAYALGTASVKEYNLTAVDLLANHQYRLAVIVDEHIAFNGGGQEANQLSVIRTYIVTSGSAAPTADELEILFTDRINQDPGKLVTAASGGVGILELTLDSVDEGDFRVESPTGTVEVITTAFVEPSGVPSQVELLAPGQSSATAEYNTYRITFDDQVRHAAVGGAFVGFPEDVLIFYDSLDADAGAFTTEMDAVLDGSHTPVTDYLGI